jgi:hypothetical protein
MVLFGGGQIFSVCGCDVWTPGRVLGGAGPEHILTQSHVACVFSFILHALHKMPVPELCPSPPPCSLHTPKHPRATKKIPRGMP